MGVRKWLQTFFGERVDKADFGFAVDRGQRQALAGFINDFIIGYGETGLTPRTLIIRGFATTVTSSTVTVTKDVGGVPGAAFLALRDEGEVQFSYCVSGGQAAINRDISNLETSDYGVFIRFDLYDSDFKNRFEWDAVSDPPRETQRNVPTRRSENWTMTVAIETPSDEWTRVATVHVDGAGVVTLISDDRNLYFEGAAANSYAITAAEIDSASIGSINRGAHGSFGLRSALRTILSVLENMRGLEPWYQDFNAGKTFHALWTQKLDRRGASATDPTKGVITGDLFPGTDNDLAFGSDTKRWFEAWVTRLYGEKIDLSTDLSDDTKISRAIGQTDGGIALLLLQAGVGGSEGAGRIELVGTGNTLAKSCEGQNGLTSGAFTTITIAANAFTPYSRQTITTAFTPSIGAIEAGDHVISQSLTWTFDTTSDVNVILEEIIVTAHNQLGFRLRNASAETRPSGAGITIDGSVTVLRAP